MTTVPTVGQHLENERCMEPGKPVFKKKKSTSTPTNIHTKTHKDTLTNCSESAQPLAIQLRPPDTHHEGIVPTVVS